MYGSFSSKQRVIVIFTLILAVVASLLIYSGSAQAQATLLSQGKAATASSFQAGNVVANGNDGNTTTTRWAASGGTFPQWWRVDLGASQSLTQAVTDWYNASTRSFKYKIEVSSDDVNYSTVVDKTGNTNTGNSTDNFSATGRYVRITVTGASAGWASFYEFQVFGGSGGATNTPTNTTVPATKTPTPTPSPTPTGTGVNFGPNVFIYDTSMSSTTIQNSLNSIFTTQQSNQFGTQRYAELFKPGTYSVTANIGFYTSIAGLGMSPNNVVINGNVTSDAQWNGGNATQNFWRSAENMRINPTGGTNTWAVSQAAPFRRMNVQGELKLDPSGDGWSSGGFIADSLVSGQAFNGSQQQYFTRDSQIGSWSSCNWNCVFVGVGGAPGQSFPTPPETNVATVPTIAEKPFLYVDSSGNFNVFVPAMRTNSSGTSWSGTPAGTSLPISQFYITQASDTASSINNALSSGLNLIVTPGVYHLSAPINVTRANTVILGLGMATFINDNGVDAMDIADVDGVRIAGLLFDAGTTNATQLLQVGPNGSSAGHASNPTILYDIFARVGGVVAGKVTQAVVVNSNNVIIDDTWLWRADHGTGVGWTANTANTGLIVNGQNVTTYGLFVEHFQQYNVIWNANGGKDYFFQNELPYDPPNQAAYMNGSTLGWAAFKVSNSVTSFGAWGVGSYCFFNVDPTIKDDHSFESPNTPGVVWHDLMTISLGNKGTILHVINSTGPRSEE